MFTRRRWIALLMVLTTLVILTPAALAADEIRLTGSFSFTDSSTCTTPIQVDGSYDEVMHSHYDQSGNPIRLAFTGSVRITYTNMLTGASYNPNSSGPGTVDLVTGTTVLRGGNGAFFDANGVLVSTDGRIVLKADGNVITLRGHVLNVCEQLGSAPKTAQSSY